MKHAILARLMLLTALGVATVGLGQEQAPTGEPGRTGATHPDDVIAARQALMLEMERLMRPIDTVIAGQDADQAEIRAVSGPIAAMLLATPHLFPPTTNRYDAAAEIPETLATPETWRDFAAFYALAAASASAAARLASADAEQLRQAAGAVRASCDACHALSLVQTPYAPPEVTDEDLDFDFDDLFSPD